jgi:hypothetical protein
MACKINLLAMGKKEASKDVGEEIKKKSTSFWSLKKVEDLNKEENYTTQRTSD